MVINIGLPDSFTLRPRITVLGLGGAGGNAVNNMIRYGLTGVDFVVANTDSQALDCSLCEKRIQLGITLTKGLGAGASPEKGRLAARESIREVLSYVGNSNMVFITAGMGGGTGTGAGPIIAKHLKKIQDDDDDDSANYDDLISDDILVVGVVTKPFDFEGSRRMLSAELGIEGMQKYVDTLIVLPNQYLFRVINEKTTFTEAFKRSDAFLTSSVREVSSLITRPGLINLDFADIKTVMSERGKAMIGIGTASGDNRAILAADAAISNPLLDHSSMKGARGVLINISGGEDMTLFEVDAAANRIKDEVDADANIIFGSTFDEEAEGTVTVSVVATGIDARADSRKAKIPHVEKRIIKKKLLVTSEGEDDGSDDDNDSFDDGGFVSNKRIVDPEAAGDDSNDSTESDSDSIENKGFFRSFNSALEPRGDTKKGASSVSDIPAFLRRNKKNNL